MKNNFHDILSRISEEPLWWDDNGTPRYDNFIPEMMPDIYADEAVLFLIRCQSCGKQFRVAMTMNKAMRWKDNRPFLLERIKDKTLHYGDPPNVNCCCAGATMGSEPMMVLEYWKRDEKSHEWFRLQMYDKWLLE